MKKDNWLEYAGPPPDLLPCPFCGQKVDPARDDEFGAVIECKRCDFEFHHNGPHLVSGAWNTRNGEEGFDPSMPEPTIEEMLALIDDMRDSELTRAIRAILEQHRECPHLIAKLELELKTAIPFYIRAFVERVEKQIEGTPICSRAMRKELAEMEKGK